MRLSVDQPCNVDISLAQNTTEKLAMNSNEIY